MGQFWWLSGVAPLLGLTIIAGGLSACAPPVTNASPFASNSAAVGATLPEAEIENESRKNRCQVYSKARLYAAYAISNENYNIMALPADAKNGSNPLCVITYNGLATAGGLAVDSDGKLWATDSSAPALEAFPPSANGPQNPTQKIEGTNTLLVGIGSSSEQGIAVDGTGNIWVPCWWGYNGFTGYVVAFGNGASGNVPPVQTIGYGDKGKSEHIAAPVATAFDHEGNLYVGEYTIPGRIVVFSPPFTDKSLPVATWTVSFLANYLAVDGSDNVYVGNFQEYYVFKHGLRSHGVIWKTISLVNDSDDIKAAPDGRIFDAVLGPSPSGNPAIAVLPAHAKTFSPKRYLTSQYFVQGPPTSLALGR